MRTLGKREGVPGAMSECANRSDRAHRIKFFLKE
ncbi:hypothetical protein J3R74_003091 [Puniceicoccus vermicola]